MIDHPAGTGGNNPTEPLASVPDTSSPAFAKRSPVSRAFDAFAATVTRWAGSPYAFGLSALSIVGWLVCGPIFHFSEDWQLVVNTGTTVITFLMVFLIQQSQNKDSVAVHLKLNELLASQKNASNKLIGIEDASEDDLRHVAQAYLELAEKAARRHTGDPALARSIETARKHVDSKPADSRPACSEDADPQNEDGATYR
ncbi:low affinity iron permease family protein [Paraburkholderia terrae]|uniref:low affinity iron permease family protein n=1 Tax=Paraburkholderia terrae TaxID=311230 RepID=UPI001EE2CDD4|nr:low affinity iron permease family protein [Paraburkholderia terrae]GJH04569.1 low affinity iron permease family protein [Paraburkholderia terrae]